MYQHVYCHLREIYVPSLCRLLGYKTEYESFGSIVKLLIFLFLTQRQKYSGTIADCRLTQTHLHVPTSTRYHSQAAIIFIFFLLEVSLQFYAVVSDTFYRDI